jgi:hypothetical protein
MLLSIDCGIKNLAMCLIDPTTKRINNWDVGGVPPKHSDGLYICLKNYLKSKPWVLSASNVIIEKQPDRNRTMKSVENFLHTYFLLNDKPVTIWDARHKIPDVSGPGKTKYAQRKKASVERAKKFLETTAVNSEWIPFFNESKKKDDLADTVMQALSYLNGPVEALPEKKNKVVKPRKPTENQKMTKYSRANLAWIIKTGGKQDARFKKDLERYYRNIEELRTEFNL